MYSTTRLPFFNIQKMAFFTTLGLVKKSLNLFSTRRREILKRLDFFSTPPNTHKTTTYKKKKMLPDGISGSTLSKQSALHYFFSFKRSRISVRRTSSLLGAGGAGSAFGSSFFLFNFANKRTIRNTQKAMIKKSKHVWIKLP